MALCKFCNVVFDWGSFDGRWVPLVPVADHEGLDRGYQDENGVLRAAHRSVCVRLGGPTVEIVKLAQPVRAAEIIGTPMPPALADGETEVSAVSATALRHEERARRKLADRANKPWHKLPMKPEAKRRKKS